MPAPKTIDEKSKEILEVREQYKETVETMDALHGKATTENRDLTPEENTEFDSLSQRAKSLSDKADRLEDIYFHMTGSRLTERNSSINIDNNISDDGEHKDIKSLHTRAYESFKDWVLNGGEHREDEYKNIAKELRAASNSSNAFSGQNMTTNTEGGYLAPHEKLHSEVIKLLNKKNIIRAHANILSLTGTSKLTIPAIADDGGDATWIAENDASPEAKMAFKQVSIVLNRLSKTIPISRYLIKNSMFDITNIIAESLSTSMSNAMEKSYLNGGGATEPLGIFSSAGGGISTARDIHVGSSTSLIDYDGLIDAESMLSESDKENAIWVLATKALAELRKLKDKNGGLVFQESMLVGEPKRLLGYPIYVSDRIASDGITANKHVGFLGNLKNYYIVDNSDMELFIYNEMYQKHYAIGLQTDMFTGGAPVREEAFVRIKAGPKPASKNT